MSDDEIMLVSEREVLNVKFVTGYANMLILQYGRGDIALQKGLEFAAWMSEHWNDVYPDASDKQNRIASRTRRIAPEAELPQVDSSQQIDNPCVYIIGCGGQPEMFKIGVANDVNKRLRQIATSNPFKPYLVHTFYTDAPYALEHELHRQFRAKRTHGEWFCLSDVDVINAIDTGEALLAQEGAA